MRNILVVLSLVLLFQLTILAVAAQQTDNGALRGKVVDPNGAGVAAATVSVKNTNRGTKRNAQTNENGEWSVAVLPLGDYEVRAEMEGFQPAVQMATVVASVTTDVVLTLGISQSAEVTIEASDSNTLVIQQGATSGSQITGRRVEELPVANRSTLGAIALDSSVAADISNPLDNGNGNPEASVNGTRTTSQTLLFNGIDSTNFSGTGNLTENIAPAPETVQEVKLLSSLYDASLGRSGGGSIQIVTKSGGNGFSGNAYIFAQNEKFNANDFFFNRDGIDRQRARRLEGGFTLGGRIIKDKLFFFGGYQRTDANTAYVPTAQSFVVLPEALAFINGARTVESIRLAFGRSNSDFRNPNCVNAGGTTLGGGACIDASGPGIRLFTTRNPITGDYIVPSLIAGRFERVFVDRANTVLFSNGREVRDPAALGFPNGVPLTDTSIESGFSGTGPLVRFRNVFPAEFKQDQFTTRLDYNLFQGKTSSNQLNGTFFFSNYPALEPFSDDTLVSPFPLSKNDRNRTLAITDTHVFNATLINEARFGYFDLNNSRELDSRLLEPQFTNTGFGIFNPAVAFVPGSASQRLARFAGSGDLQDFSVAAPNDIFNERKQVTLTFADNLTLLRNAHTFRFGIEHKRNGFDANLPEEQGGEFEKIINFRQVLLSFAPEADTAFGITDKEFRFNDLSFYVSDDWRVNSRLSLNLGLRWDWFGRPVEKNGRFTNFDPSLLTNPNDVRAGIIVPSNVSATGFNAIDASVPGLTKSENKHTLNGEDLNNFAPRVGFAFKPFNTDKTVIRGGYGVFYDRPSAAFINTVYKNFPFLREVEQSRSVGSPFAVQVHTVFQGQDPSAPFINQLPFRIAGPVGGYSGLQLMNRTPLPGTALDDQRNLAEPLEFRAVDRDLKTPFIQQWNLGLQQELGKGWTLEVRYAGTRGQNLLLAVGFNQPYDLNDPNTPEYIFRRLNDASGIPEVPAGVSQRDRGRQFFDANGNPTGNPFTGAPAAFGWCNRFFGGRPGYSPCPSGPLQGGYDFNLDPSPGGDNIISAALRVPYLGFDPTDAVMLQSRGYSTYHSGQLNVTKRLAHSLALNASYTFSKSIDIGSTDPGSTAASGRPDTPNAGLVVQGDQRDLNANRALSDFDRPHRFAASFVWELPNFHSKSKFLTGWQLSGFGQWQSGTPFTIFNSEPDFFVLVGGNQFQDQFIGFVSLPGGNAILGRKVADVGFGSGKIFASQFARPSVRSLELLRRRNCNDFTRCYFNTGQRTAGFINPAFDQNPDANAGLISPLGGFGNLGRNILRGPVQRRIDLSFQKSIKISDRVALELKWDIFNVFNFVNYANPNSDLSDESDFGQITRTLGAPRVMQFGAKVRF
jgi:hypothetical protein